MQATYDHIKQYQTGIMRNSGQLRQFTVIIQTTICMWICISLSSSLSFDYIIITYAGIDWLLQNKIHKHSQPKTLGLYPHSPSPICIKFMRPFQIKVDKLKCYLDNLFQIKFMQSWSGTIALWSFNDRFIERRDNTQDRK